MVNGHALLYALPPQGPSTATSRESAQHVVLDSADSKQMANIACAYLFSNRVLLRTPHPP